jgi:hypothetical protein
MNFFFHRTTLVLNPGSATGVLHLPPYLSVISPQCQKWEDGGSPYLRGWPHMLAGERSRQDVRQEAAAQTSRHRLACERTNPRPFRKEEVSSQISEVNRLSGIKQMRNRHLINMAALRARTLGMTHARRPIPGRRSSLSLVLLKEETSLSLPPPPLPPSPLLLKALLGSSDSLPWHPPARHSRRRPWRCDHWTTILRPRHAHHHTPSSSLQFLHHVCRPAISAAAAASSFLLLAMISVPFLLFNYIILLLSSILIEFW